MLNPKIWNSEKCWILWGNKIGLSSPNNPCHRKFILCNLCWYLHSISWSLATLQKRSATLIITMIKYFSTAYLKNLSTHAQASPVSDLHQSIPCLAKPAYLLRHYGDASQMLDTLTRFYFFKNSIFHPCNALLSSWIFCVVLSIYIFLPVNWSLVYEYLKRLFQYTDSTSFFSLWGLTLLWFSWQPQGGERIH